MTELHHAALKGNVEEIERSLISGANVQPKGTNDLTILLVIAAHEGHWNLLLFLISYGGDSLFDDKQQVYMNREHNASFYIDIYYSFSVKCYYFDLSYMNHLTFAFINDLACSPVVSLVYHFNHSDIKH